jgi:hypothetical protein
MPRSRSRVVACVTRSVAVPIVLSAIVRVPLTIRRQPGSPAEQRILEPRRPFERQMFDPVRRRSSFAMAAMTCLLAGCGGATTALRTEPRAAGPDRVSSRPEPAPMPAHRSLPPNSIRVVGGPVVLRVEGATHHPLMRYALIFRLSRAIPRFPVDPRDPDAGPIRPDGALTQLGNYSIEHFPFDFSNAIFAFTPPRREGHDNCYFGRLSTADGVVVDQLDQIADGARVHVALHPLTPAADGEPAFARLSTRRPRMIVAHVRPYTAIRYATDGLYLQVTSPAALAAIGRAGCESTVLE